MQRQSLPLVHNQTIDRDVLRMSPCVCSILVDLGDVTTSIEKIQRNMQLARSPVRDTSEVPFLAVTARDCDELARFAVENVHRIPLGRNIVNKLELWLMGVGLGTIGDHLKWSLKDHIQRQLLGSGAPDHRTRIAPNKFILRDIIETAWR